MTRVLLRLRDGGVCTTRGHGWQRTALRRYLLSPTVIGASSYRGQLVKPDAWDPIVSPAEQEALRGLFARHHARGRSPRFLLTGLLYCGRCGGRLHGWTRPNGRQSYRCPANNELYRGCGMTRTGAPIEAEVGRLVVARLEASEFPAEPDDGESTAQALARAITTDEAWLERLAADYYGARSIEAHEYQAARKAIVERLEANRRALASAQRRAGKIGDWHEIARHWDSFTVPGRRAVLDVLVERITLHHGGKGRPFSPDQLDVAFRL
jgi:hypothetical protein